MERKPKRRWHSILTDGMPPLETQVLIYCDCHPEYGPPNMAVDWRVKGPRNRDLGWFYSEQLDNPTHWMELPDVPRCYQPKKSK